VPERLTGVAEPVHVGRRMIVVQTSIYRPDGKLAAMSINYGSIFLELLGVVLVAVDQRERAADFFGKRAYIISTRTADGSRHWVRTEARPSRHLRGAFG
jgi:hypothetical protein